MNVANQYSETPLCAAAKASHVEILEKLIMAGASIDAASGGDNTALYEATKAGNIHIIHRLLIAGANVNVAIINGETALHRAAEAGRTEVIKRLLLTADIHLDAITSILYSGTALIAAAACGYTEVVEFLLAAGANANIGFDGPTALEVAAEGGFTDIVSLLLAAGVNSYSPASRKALLAASRSGHKEVVNLLLASGGDMSFIDIGDRDISVAAKEFGYFNMLALHRAVRDDNINVAKDLLAICTFVDANRGGNTPLQIAARGGHTEMVEMLLMAGADVNAGAIYTTKVASHANYTIDMRDNSMAIGDHKHPSHRETALVLAVECGYIDVAQRLLASGADVNALTKNEESLLAVAAKRGDSKMVELLLTASIVVNTKSVHTTAFGAAMKGGHVEILKTLLAEGFDLKTYPLALTVAVGNHYIKVVKCLLAVGADVNSYDGQKAMRQAAAIGLTEVVEMLLVAGADVNNPNCQVALELAERYGHVEVAEKLLAAGVR